MSEKNQQLIEGLRQLLAFVEANDDFEFVRGSETVIAEVNFRTWWINGEDNRRVAIADLTRRLARVGKVEKVYSDNYAWVRLALGPHVRIEISTMRETICERVVVGKKVIAAQPERVIPATQEQTVDEIEWRCHPVMTAGSSHVIEGQVGELESGTDPATLQLEAVAAGIQEDDDSIPF